MLQKYLARVCAVVLCIGTLGTPMAIRAFEPEPLVVATYAYPKRDRIAAIRPLADYLAARSGRAVEVRLLPSPTALIEAMGRGEVDIAVPNLHGYLQSRNLRDLVVALPVPEVPPAQADRYRAVLVARAGIDSIETLQRQASGLRLVLVGADSASGGFVPARRLRELGLDPVRGFTALAYAGSHAAALEALAGGKADVAALAADVFDAQAPANVHELWRSAPIPPGPLLCRTAAMSCTDVSSWLMESGRRDPRVMAGLRYGWPEFGDATDFAPPPPMREALDPAAD